VRQNGGSTDLMAVVVEAGDEDTAPQPTAVADDDQLLPEEEPPFDGEPEKKTFVSPTLVALDNQLREAVTQRYTDTETQGDRDTESLSKIIWVVFPF